MHCHSRPPVCLLKLSDRNVLCTSVAASTGSHNRRSATHGDLFEPRTRMITYGPHSFAISGACLEQSATNSACSAQHTQTVSEQTRDVTEPAKMRISYEKSVGCGFVARSKFVSASYYSYCDSTGLLSSASLVTKKSHTIHFVFISIK